MYACVNFVFSLSIVEDAFYMCPDRLRLPLIFYYGHTASVYVNKLLQAEFIQVFCHRQSLVGKVTISQTEKRRWGAGGGEVKGCALLVNHLVEVSSSDAVFLSRLSKLENLLE